MQKKEAHETEVISFGERLDPLSSPSFGIESTAWMETRFLVNQGECLKARMEVDIGGGYDKP